MKILKYTQFLNEELNDTPDSYVFICLKQIKAKIDKMFDFQNEEENKKDGKSISDARKHSRDKSKLTLKDMGVTLESSEISKYSKLYDSLTVKFSDDNAWYNLFIAIDYKEALPKDNENFSYEDIKKCYVKFKKYNSDTNEIDGQVDKNIDISEISEDFLIDLKVEIDEKFGDQEEFKIET